MTRSVFRSKVALLASVISILTACSAVVGCSGGSEEETRVSASKNQLIGVYRLKLDGGVEQLELRDHDLYIQDDTLNGKQFHHEGRWQLTSHTLDGSEIRLVDAKLFDQSDQQHHVPTGDISLQVHIRGGKLELARNEVADWYYERLD